MQFIETFIVQNQYSHWMNEHMFTLCDTVPDNHRKKSLGAFFGSIHRTLNHILLVDRLWLSRFENSSLSITGLDQELYVDYNELKTARRETDDQLTRYIGKLQDQDMDRKLTFTSAITHKSHSFLLGDCLVHMFHHQTHHRGQISALISQLGVDIGNTDLLWMPGIEQRAKDTAP